MCCRRRVAFFARRAQRLAAAAAAAAALGGGRLGVRPTKSYVRVYGFEVTAVTQPVFGNIMGAAEIIGWCTDKGS